MIRVRPAEGPSLFMEQILTTIEIEASPARVWQVLTDFSAYPEWNSVIPQIRGEAISGTRLQVWVRFVAGITVSFRPKVLHAENGRELRWQGRLLRTRLLLDRESLWLLILMVLLPVATTMALLWKIKEVILTGVFGMEN